MIFHETYWFSWKIRVIWTRTSQKWCQKRDGGGGWVFFKIHPINSCLYLIYIPKYFVIEEEVVEKVKACLVTKVTETNSLWLLQPLHALHNSWINSRALFLGTFHNELSGTPQCNLCHPQHLQSVQQPAPKEMSSMGVSFLRELGSTTWGLWQSFLGHCKTTTITPPLQSRAEISTVAHCWFPLLCNYQV